MSLLNRKNKDYSWKRGAEILIVGMAAIFFVYKGVTEYKEGGSEIGIISQIGIGMILAYRMLKT
jgi:hypothetical protein